MKSFERMKEAKETRKTFGKYTIWPYLLFLGLTAAVNAVAVGVLPLADIARGQEVTLSPAQNVFKVCYTIFNAVFVPLMLFGVYRVYLVFARGQRPAFSVLFDGFFNFIRVWILFFLKTMMIGIGLMVFVLPGIFFFYSTALTNFIFSDDEDMQPWTAISESFRLMNGNRFRLFQLQLSFLGWFLLVVVTLGLALVYVGPYYMTALAQFYDEIKEKDLKRAARSGK